MKTLSTIVLPLAFAALLANCGGSDEGILAEQGYSIELDNGGFELGQTAPEFSSFELKRQAMQSMSYDLDDQAEALALSTSDQPEGRKVFILRLAWGQFPFKPELTEPTHWRGLVYGLGAKVFVQRAIYYENHDFFRPCRGHDCVRIDSRTLPHHDGLVLKIVPTHPDAQVLIGFEGLYGRIIPLQALEGLTDVGQVDDLGNKVVLDAFARPPCPAGMLGGVWKRLDERGGVFAGDWLNEEGLVAGKLTGIWGERKSGEKVMFGIYGDFQGQFLGLIRGGYVHPSLVGGVFAGHWTDRNGDLAGVLGGRFGPHPNGQPVAVFHGRFQAGCGQALPPAAIGGLPAEPDDCFGAGVCETTGQVLEACQCEDTPPNEAADCLCQP